MTVISDTKSLRAFCERQKGADFITVDTEFMRESTYWPLLCLVQVGGPEEAVVIDALADRLDLAPLLELLADQSILKVFHAGRQDMEIFHQLMDGALPRPIFDTQVAAMVCGFGDQVSYERLTRALLDVQIDKGSRFADWSKRPLGQRQIDYALSDVTHLRKAYRRLKTMLEESGRASWLEAEMDVLADPATYASDPREAWLRVKSRSSNRRYLAALRELAAWREEQAQKRNIPRNRILKDEQLSDIAANRPKTAKDLAATRGLSKDYAEGRMGQGILAALKTAEDLPKDALPQPSERRNLPPGLGPVIELLKVLLKARCEEYDVAQKLVANTADLEEIAADDQADVRALSGWRREIFGADALALKHGRLALAIEAKTVKVLNLE